jgi:hypothetical protein
MMVAFAVRVPEVAIDPKSAGVGVPMDAVALTDALLDASVNAAPNARTDRDAEAAADAAPSVTICGTFRLRVADAAAELASVSSGVTFRVSDVLAVELEAASVRGAGPGTLNPSDPVVA